MFVLRVLVTGANGFVGRALSAKLLQDGVELTGAVRNDRCHLAGDVVRCAVGNIDAKTDWMPALSNVDVVVHLAGRAHVMHETQVDPLVAYREINTAGALNLARQAASAGVRRLVFVSSIKVCGEGQERPDEDAYTEMDAPAPSDPYVISKWEAEQGLRLIAESTGLEVVILRPPLVYGPGVGANFLRLMRSVKSGWPLPLGAVANRRSLIYIGNLVDAISMSARHPAAANKTFLLSDGDDVSTPELIRRIASAFGVPARLLSVPEPWLRLAGTLLRKGPAVDRLLGSLIVDASAIRRDLGWSPPLTMQQGLAETLKWYEGKHGR